MIFLDHAATSLLKPPSVEQAIRRALHEMASPGRGAYRPAMQAAETLYRCREQAASLFHVTDPSRVVFTMNATHGLNIAIHSLAKAGSTVLISGFEHNSVTRPLHALGCRIRIAGRKLFDREDTLRDFRSLLPGSDLVICTAVSNVFGYILPIGKIAGLCREASVPLIVDASQAAGVLDLDFSSLGAAFMAMPGHKGLLGPQGTGLLLCADPGVSLMQGGSGSESRVQEMPEDLPDHLEAGTHNVCGIAGLLAGLEYVRRRSTERILRHEQRLLQLAAQELGKADCELFLGTTDNQCGVLSLRSEKTDCESLALLLGEKGICVRSGLHCAPLAHESAGTLETGTLRLSFSPLLEERQVSQACRTIRAFL